MNPEDLHSILGSSQVFRLLPFNDCLYTLCSSPNCLNNPAPGKVICNDCATGIIPPKPKGRGTSIPLGWQERTKNCTPKWADLQKIDEIYIESSRISAITKIKHHVDHIVPLKHKKVCGLHCEANLRIIPATENYKKHNNFTI